MLETILVAHPDWVHKASDEGETCLHVAGIRGQEEVTAVVIKAGGDPNVRSTYENGLRMHPLSWNVYHGNVGTARVLLENGAQVNLDVDHMTNDRKVTVLDIVEEIIENTLEGNPLLHQYKDMRQLLLSNGAKRYTDLVDQEL